MTAHQGTGPRVASLLVLMFLVVAGCDAVATDEQVELADPGEFEPAQPDEGLHPLEQTERLEEPPGVAPPEAEDGRALYGANCAVCHQADGSGAGAGAIPPLAGNGLITAEDPVPMIQAVLDGRGGMPTFEEDFDDEELADLVSYLRQLGSNDASPVTTADIEEAREAERFIGMPGVPEE